MTARPLVAWPGVAHLLYAARVEAAVTLLFCAVYGGADFVAGLHDVRVPVHLDAELRIPFVPAATVVYSSVYAMFLGAPFVLRTREEIDRAARAVVAQIAVAGVLFLVIPAEPAFPDGPRDLGVWGAAFLAADAVNLTYNMLPSLHVAFAATFAALFAARARGAARVGLLAWGLAICVSTLLTHQHHVADVVAGVALAALTLPRPLRRDAGLGSATNGPAVLGAVAADEAALIERASAEFPDLRFEDLTAERLAGIARERGIDFATALAYDRVRRSGDVAAAIEALEVPERLPRLDAEMLVAPAAFYREKPRFGGDGRLVREVAARFGIASELLPASSLGGVAENARPIAERLARHGGGPLVLVSLSKGAADLRTALDLLGRAPARPCVWLQICGLAHGSPFADLVLGSPFRRAAAAGYLRLHGARLSVFEELRAAPPGPLAAPWRAPDGVFVINVIGFPLARHLGRNARRRHAAMRHLGPNDGGALLRGACVEPGVVVPVWGADHYFRIPEAEELLTRLFCYLAATGRLERGAG